ncbi:MAG: hypothetical protein J0H49_23515 [Acidobacteria bacterium]|nr:hypothetical protein [Acidobacteriota bacterium]
MRFMMMIKATKESEAGQPPSPELMAAVGELTREGMKSGTVISTGGLGPSSQGARIRASGGTLRVTDGPFAEAKELIAGFAIIEAPDKAAAIEQGRKMMDLHVKTLGPSYEGECEIRTLFEPPPCAD